MEEGLMGELRSTLGSFGLIFAAVAEVPAT